MQTILGQPTTVEELEQLVFDPYAQWYAAGMPVFCQPKQKARVYVVWFATKEDRERFFSVVGAKHTDKTDSIRFPPVEREQNLLSQYIEE